eukprot:3108501-Rhodomonas_salina.1
MPVGSVGGITRSTIFLTVLATSVSCFAELQSPMLPRALSAGAHGELRTLASTLMRQNPSLAAVSLFLLLMLFFFPSSSRLLLLAVCSNVFVVTLFLPSLLPLSPLNPQQPLLLLLFPSPHTLLFLHILLVLPPNAGDRPRRSGARHTWHLTRLPALLPPPLLLLLLLLAPLGSPSPRGLRSCFAPSLGAWPGSSSLPASSDSPVLTKR